MGRISKLLGLLMTAFIAGFALADTSVTIICANKITVTNRVDSGGEDVLVTLEEDGAYYSAPTSYNISGYVTTLIAPLLSGYRFLGWYTMEEDDVDQQGSGTSVALCTKSLTQTVMTEITDSIIDTAATSAAYWDVGIVCPQYEPTITIVTNVSPAGAGTASVSSSDGKFRTDGMIAYEKTCTLTAKANAGYSFSCWTKGGASASSDDSYSFTAAAGLGGEYTAVFTGIWYRVTLNANSGKFGKEGTTNILAQYGAPMPALSCLPERYGYDFAGFYDDAACEGNRYYDATGQGTANWDRAAAGVLYAKWKPRMATLRLRFNEGVAAICYRLEESSSWVTNTDETDVSLQVGTMVHAYGIPEEGYEITKYGIEDQWATAKDVGIPADGVTCAPEARRAVKTYTVTFHDPSGTFEDCVRHGVTEGTAAIAPGWSRFGHALTWDRDFSCVMSALTVNAVWTPITSVIRFDANGGSGAMADITATYDQPVTLSANAFACGIRSFVHWTTTVDVVVGGAVTSVATNFTDQATVSNLTVTAGATNTLFAVWNTDYLVAFNGNGATSGSMENQHFFRDEEQSLDPNEYARTGYTFLGWATNAVDAASRRVSYEDQAVVTNLAEVGTTNALVATWSNNPYRVEYDMNGVATSTTPDARDCKYDEAWRLPKAPVPLKGEYQFNGWSTDDGKLDKVAAGTPVSNLTATADVVVTVRAVWSVDYGDLSRALGGDALKLKFVCDDETGWSDWYCDTKEATTQSPSTTCVGKRKYVIDSRLRAEIDTSGELSFQWTGEYVSLKVFLAYGDEEGECVYDGNGSTSWSSVALTIKPDSSKGTALKVIFKSDADSSWPIQIADMTWTPDEEHPEPVEGRDNAVISAASVSDGKFVLAFAATNAFDYVLWTNADLSASAWGEMTRTNGENGVICFEPPVLTELPQLFYKVETIQKK